MAIVTITIPDEVFDLVVETYAAAHGWESVERDGSARAYAKARLIDGIMGTLRAQHGEAAAAVARQAAIDEVNQFVKIT